MDDRFVHREEYPITAGDFSAAGDASARIKYVLRKLGIDSALVRRVAIAAYESEMNMVIHSAGGTLTLTVDRDRIGLGARDSGPGIPDIDIAMQEGYSTASEAIRELGFGAGMGLPNMRRCSDRFAIRSSPGGTVIDMEFTIGNESG